MEAFLSTKQVDNWREDYLVGTYRVACAMGPHSQADIDLAQMAVLADRFTPGCNYNPDSLAIFDIVIMDTEYARRRGALDAATRYVLRKLGVL